MPPDASALPVFDPTKPFTEDQPARQQGAPVFDPSKPFQDVTPEAQPFAASPEVEEANRFGDVATGEAADHFFSNARLGVSHVLDAFGQGAKDGWGSQPLGLGDEADALLKKWNLLPKPGEVNLAKAFNEAIIRPLAIGADAALRAGSAAVGAFQGLAAQTGAELGAPQLGRDIAAMPEAFFGAPGDLHFGAPHLAELRDAKALDVIGSTEAQWKGTALPANAAQIAEQARAADIENTRLMRGQLGEHPGWMEAPELAQAATEVAPAPDIHAAARRVAPDTMRAYDGMQDRMQQIRQQIADVPSDIDAQIADAEARAQRVKPDAAAVWERRASELRDGRDDLIAQQQGELRQHLQAIDFQMRDLAPEVAAAYREAEARIQGDDAMAEEEPITTTEPAPQNPKETTAAQPEMLAEPATSPPHGAEPEEPASAVTTPAHLQFIRDDVAKQLTAAGRPLDEAQAASEIVAAHYDARAARFEGAKGTAQDLYEAEAPTVKGGTQKQRAKEFAQTAKGKIKVADDGRAVITLMKDADASTFIHETGHQWLEEMMRDAADAQAPADLIADAKTVRDWLGAKEDSITRAQHEKFARGFERYMMEGRAPSPGLAGVFEKFRDWLTRIYKTVADLKSPITDDIRDVFDRLISKNPERQPAAGPKPDLLRSIHEADAEHTPPRHAEEAADRVEAEIKEQLNAGTDAGAAEAAGSNRPGESDSERRPPEPGEPSGLGGGAGETAEESAPVRGTSEPEPAAKQQPAEQPGDAAQPLIQEGPRVDKAGNIRLDNMDSPEAFKQALRDIADRNDDFFSERGGVRTDALVSQLADASGMTWREIEDFAKVMRMGDVVIKKATQAFVEASRDSAQAAKNWREAPTEANEMEAMRAYGRLEMMQGTFSSLTADPGRMMRQLAKGDEWKAAGVPRDQVITEASGRTPEQWRTLFQSMATMDTPAKAAKLARQSQLPTFWKRLQNYVLNNLISGVATHTTYMIGNTLLSLHNALFETGGAAAIGAMREALGKDVADRVYFGEVPAQLYGMVRGYRDGFPAAWDAIKANKTGLLPGEEAPPDLGMVKAHLFPGIAGEIESAPSRVVTGIHTLYRTMNYERSIAALSYRMAVKEGLTGEPLAARIGALRDNPPVELMDQARAEANAMTLMQKPEYRSAMQKFEAFSNANFATKMTFPFVRIATNIVNEALVQRGVIGFLSQDVRDNLSGKNGGTARDMQAAKILMGSALGAMTVGLAVEGLVTGGGPADANHRAGLERTGWRPYSIRIGDFYVPYKRLGPLGMIMGVAAEGVDLAHEMSEKDATHWASSLTMAVSHTVLDETWMSGLSSVVKALNDPDRYGAPYIKSLASDFIPYSVFFGQLAAAHDPYVRETKGIFDGLRNKIPVAREMNLPRYDIWGQPIAQAPDFPISGLTALSMTPVNRDPVNQAMLDVGAYPAPVKRQIRNIPLTNEQYGEYQRLAGVYAHMVVEQMISNPGWQAIPVEVRRLGLMGKISEARQAAETAIQAKSVGTDNDIVKQANAAKMAKFGKKETPQ